MNYRSDALLNFPNVNNLQNVITLNDECWCIESLTVQLGCPEKTQLHFGNTCAIYDGQKWHKIRSIRYKAGSKSSLPFFNLTNIKREHKNIT